MEKIKAIKKEEHISTLKQGIALNIFFYVILFYYVLKTLYII